MSTFVRAAVSVGVGFLVAFTLSALFVPDPTGVAVLFAGSAGTLVLVPLLYYGLFARLEGQSSSEPDATDEQPSYQRK